MPSHFGWGYLDSLWDASLISALTYFEGVLQTAFNWFVWLLIGLLHLEVARKNNHNNSSNKHSVTKRSSDALACSCFAVFSPRLSRNPTNVGCCCSRMLKLLHSLFIVLLVVAAILIYSNIVYLTKIPVYHMNLNRRHHSNLITQPPPKKKKTKKTEKEKHIETWIWVFTWLGVGGTRALAHSISPAARPFCLCVAGGQRQMAVIILCPCRPCRCFLHACQAKFCLFGLGIHQQHNIFHMFAVSGMKCIRRRQTLGRNHLQVDFAQTGSTQTRYAVLNVRMGQAGNPITICLGKPFNLEH